jgi:hypothetical protein
MENIQIRVPGWKTFGSWMEEREVKGEGGGKGELT